MYVELSDDALMNQQKSSSGANSQNKSEEPGKPGPPRDYTTVLPMFDLEEAIKLVVAIRDKALETAALPMVAKGCGYAASTSTPFYRRLLAARLFKLLMPPQAELTTVALDYLKPDRDDAKQSALTKAIMGIPAYAGLIQKNVGRKLNPELVGNSFQKSFNLTTAGASICARAFISSLRFAGFISLDGTVFIPLGGANAVNGEAKVPTEPPKPKVEEEEDDEETQSQTLYLDSKRKRKITIKAPLAVTKEELERIRAWLGFQLIVEEESPSAPNPMAQ